jgi:uncharacterized protein YjhX (UPF0386 family)
VSRSKSSRAAAQRQRILAALRIAPRTSHDLRCEGIYQPGARIKELRDAGHNIATERVKLWDRDGYEHPRAALYSLIAEAGGGRHG